MQCGGIATGETIMENMTNQEVAAMIGVRICTAKAYGCDGFMRHAIKADCGTVIDRVKPSALRAWLVNHARLIAA